MKKQKLHIVTVCVFVAFLLVFSVGFWILPDRSFSAQENRSLRTFPRFTWERLFDGSFSEEINEYFADQFPVRDEFVGLKGMAENALLKGENNGILLGKNGQLAQRLFDVHCADGRVIADCDGFDADNVRAAGEGLTRVSQSLDVPFSVLLTGRTIDVAASAFSYPREGSDALLEAMRASIGDGVDYVQTVPELRERYDAGESVYYRTDHHWTTLGAYYAYAELMRSFSMESEILPMEAFTKETLSNAFYGTAWSAGGMKQVAPDALEIWLLGNEAEFTVTADGRALEGLYSYSYLEKKDKYSVFLDGTHDVVTITKEGEDRPTLLLLKDSFANSLAPFLAQHFDLVLLNLSSTRNDYTNLSERVAEYSADRALIVYTLENVITADKLSRLR